MLHLSITREIRRRLPESGILFSECAEFLRPVRDVHPRLHAGSEKRRRAGRRSSEFAGRFVRRGRSSRRSAGNSVYAYAGPPALRRSSVNQRAKTPAGMRSNTSGRYLIFPRTRAIAVAIMRRWSSAIGAPNSARACSASRTKPAS